MTFELEELSLQILLYGVLADVLGRQVEIDVPAECSIADLRRKLECDYPLAARDLGRSRAIIGASAVADDYLVTTNDRVEFLPPVSGG